MKIKELNEALNEFVEKVNPNELNDFKRKIWQNLGIEDIAEEAEQELYIGMEFKKDEFKDCYATCFVNLTTSPNRYSDKDMQDSLEEVFYRYDYMFDENFYLSPLNYRSFSNEYHLDDFEENKDTYEKELTEFYSIICKVIKDQLDSFADKNKEKIQQFQLQRQEAKETRKEKRKERRLQKQNLNSPYIVY